VNVKYSLCFCIDESGRFQRLNAVVRPAAVVLAGGFTVEERRVHRGVIGGVVQLRPKIAERFCVRTNR
jgi:hypothetical protein